MRKILAVILAIAVVLGLILVSEFKSPNPGSEVAVPSAVQSTPGIDTPATYQKQDLQRPAVPGVDAPAGSPGSGQPSPPRTSAGLREQKVSIRLPVIDRGKVPEARQPESPTSTGMAFVALPGFPDSNHPLAPGEHIAESGDGPRGPNPIAPDPAAPGPAVVQAQAVPSIVVPEGTSENAPVDPDGEGPALPISYDEVARLPGPGQGVADPNSPGPE